MKEIKDLIQKINNEIEAIEKLVAIHIVVNRQIEEEKMKRSKPPEKKFKRTRPALGINDPPDRGYGGHMPYPPTECHLEYLIVTINDIPIIDNTRCTYYCPKYCDRYKEFWKEWKRWRDHQFQITKKETEE